MSTVIIKLSPDNWQKYRDIRLIALKSDPLAFASSYEQEIQFDEQIWRQNIHNMWFAMVNSQVVGMIGMLIIEESKNTNIGYVVSLWVSPQFQKRQIGQALVRAIQNFAAPKNLKKLILEVTASNQAAIGL